MKSWTLLLAALPALAQQHWVATWGTAQQQYRAAARPAPTPTPPAARPPQPPPRPPAHRLPVPPPPPHLHTQPPSHTFGLRPTYISREGDFTARPEFADPASTTQSWYCLAGIDVQAPADAFTIVTFGDSITDGDQSTPDSNNPWPSLLARRLQG